MSNDVDIKQDIGWLPSSTEDFEKDLPSSWEECISLVQGSMGIAMKQTIACFWYSGRIIQHLTEIYGDGTMEKLAEQTGYSQRHLYAMKKAYSSFPRYEYVETMMDRHLGLGDVKELSRLPEDYRDEALKLLKAGNLLDDGIEDYVNHILKGREEKEKEKEGDVEVIQPEITPSTDSKDNDHSDKPDNSLGSIVKWFEKLHSIMIEMGRMEVSCSDISSKLGELDKEDGTDPDYIKCREEIESIRDEADYIYKYLAELRSVLS